MTERTHDLAALTALTIAFVTTPLTSMTLATAAFAVIANQIGSAVPDLDQPTAEFYRELPAGSFIGRLVAPLLGGHRYLSHTLLGLGLAGWLLSQLLGYLNHVLLTDMNVVWWAFFLGYLSHLVADTFTKEGVPWLFPIPWRLGLPPFKFLRIKTGQFTERLLIYPGLLALNGYLVYTHYGKFAEFFSKYLLR